MTESASFPDPPPSATWPDTPIVVRGEWLWTGERLVRRGGVVIRDGRVEAILEEGEAHPSLFEAAIQEFRRGLIHPGLVNAHCHLDLSALGGGIPLGLPFPLFLAGIRERRAEMGTAGLLEAARRGVRALIAAGTTAVVDFAHGGLSELPVREAGIRAAILREVIGPDLVRAKEAGSAAQGWITSRTPGPRVFHGLAPHSPYLATPDLIRGCREWCGGGLLSIHAAEFPEESRFLREGTGELRDFLEAAGIDLAGFRPPGVGPIEHLEVLGVLKGALLVHASCLEPGDAERIARAGAVVVFCPRSQRFFGRPPYPLPALLDAGVRVLLGTDSAASNWGLSVADEMREVRRLFPSLPAEAIFAMGTAAGGLGPLPGDGRLQVGGPADVTVTCLYADTEDPLEAFLRKECLNGLTMVGGQDLTYRAGGREAE